MPNPTRCLAVLLAALLILPPGEPFAFAKKRKKQPIAADSSPLTQDQRVLHALNRLTFGPRPGDVQAVEAMGLDKWIDQQLNPEKIDDSALEARLSVYPAMGLNLRQLTERFPTNAMIRQAERGKLPLPSDPVERAIYRNQIAYLRERQAKQAEQARQNAAEAQAVGQPGAAAQPMVAQKSGPGPAPAMEQGNPPPPPADAMTPGNAPPMDANAMQPAAMNASAMQGEMQPEEAMASPNLKNAEDKLYADLAATNVVTLAPDQRVQALLAMPPGQFRDFLQHLSRPDRVALFADLTPIQKETVFALISPQLVVGGEVLVTRLLRDIYSERQLEAVMTDFWLNHFNVYLKKGEYAAWYLAQYQDQVIRPHALGKFEDLLVATAESPAMLFYLDQTESVGPHSLAAMRAAMNNNGRARPLGLNENYAREVMELHTLGVDGGYTQRDVTELAKVFTGWGIDHPEQGAEFFFNERRHEPGQKVLLGHIIPENGQNEGLEVLHMLAVSPATAHHVSFQLAQRFVSDNPPPQLVDAMAATWVKTGGDIREVLRTMLASPQFWSQAAYRAKVKTPEEYVISAVRATDGEVVHPAALVEAIGQLGMPLYGCQTPNGYSWNADAWLNSGELLDRMNFSLALADNNAGTLMRWDEHMNIIGRPDVTAQQKETLLENLLLDGPASDQTRNAALAQAEQQDNTPVDQQQRPPPMKPVNFVRPREFGQLLQAAAPLPPPGDQDAALLGGLLLGSPEFQRR
ncbi:MAG TPA: DUF1800 family protein [Acidobacteriaceae bacterium]|nr:DUF1800 family protein [Acidobacteriaceae bacterium]